MIDKAHELRVVAFGDEIVSFRIDSQERSFTRMDWRAGEPLLACPVVETPTLIREPIAAFLALSGLHSSVFDFAVTPEGRTVFFESNPAGQWANMDGLNDYVVSRMFARQMARCIQAAPARPATSSPFSMQKPHDPTELRGYSNAPFHDQPRRPSAQGCD